VSGKIFLLAAAAVLVAGSIDAATLLVANKSDATVSLVDLKSGKVGRHAADRESAARDRGLLDRRSPGVETDRLAHRRPRAGRNGLLQARREGGAGAEVS
jgi:hypothetical protein